MNARPGDLTTVRAQALEAEHKEEKAARAAELSMLNQVDERAQRQDTLVDYFKTAGEPLPEPEKPDELDEPFRVVRFKLPVQQMTFGREIRTETYTDENNVEHTIEVPGAIRSYDFTEGSQYRLPREMADHLAAKGFLA